MCCHRGAKTSRPACQENGQKGFSRFHHGVSTCILWVGFFLYCYGTTRRGGENRKAFTTIYALEVSVKSCYEYIEESLGWHSFDVKHGTWQDGFQATFKSRQHQETFCRLADAGLTLFDVTRSDLHDLNLYSKSEL